MELDQYVSETIKQILKGVSDAQKDTTTKGCVNPKISNLHAPQAGNMQIFTTDNDEGIHLVDFDLVVNAVEGTGTSGGIGLFVGPIALGSRGESNAENSSSSRIKFRVPISYPDLETSA